MVKPEPDLNAALTEMRDETFRVLRLHEIVAWLAPRMPPWVDRLPLIKFWHIAAVILAFHLTMIAAILWSL